MAVKGLIGRVRAALDQPETRGTAAALALFGACAWLLTWRLWAPNPADRLMIGSPDGDFARQFVAYRTWVAEAWSSFRPPLWNPHQYAGTPAWADPQMAVLYPFRAVQALVASVTSGLPVAAVTLEVPVHLTLAGVFTFLLARRLGVSAAPAALAGVTFMAGGYLTGYPVEQLPVLVTAAWIPGVLWAVTAVADAAPGPRRVRAILATGIVTAGLLSAGHPQTALYGLIWAAVWAVVRSHRGSAASPRGTQAPAAAAAAALGGIGFGVALSAAAWLPAAELLGHLARDLSVADQLAGFAPGELLGALLPHAGGRWWPLWVGTAALGLAAAALAVRSARFWLASAGIAVLVAMGGRLPVLPALLSAVPGLSLFRHHERVAVVASLALAVAAALALDALMTGTEARRRRAATGFVLAGLTALAVSIAAAGRPLEAGIQDDLALLALAALATSTFISRRMPWGVVGVAALQLVAVNEGHGMTPWFDPYPGAAAMAPMAADSSRRVSSEALLPGGANAAMVHGLYDVTGDSPFHLAAIEALQADVPELVWWRLLNVGWVATARTFDEGAPLERVSDEGAQVGLYRVMVDSAPVWTAPEEAIDVARLAEVAIDMPMGPATLTGRGPFRAAAEVELAEPATVVLSTAYAPGWRARAVGPAGSLSPPVVPAYGALMASPLPAGQWSVRWTYMPSAVILGLVVSFVAAVGGGVLWLRTRPASRP